MPTLRTLIEQPTMRAAFARHAQGWPEWTSLSPLPSERAIDSAHASAAFAYLVQMEVARWQPPSGVRVAQTGWLAQIGLHTLSRRPATADHAPMWQAWMSQFLPCVNRHVQGHAVPFRHLAMGAWRLAYLDSLCRSPLMHAESFATLPTPSPAQIQQLSIWLGRWKEVWRHLPVPARRVWIHPDLAALGQVTQAETQLILDGQLVSIRGLGDGLSASVVRWLAGQAAWARVAGVYGVKGRMAPDSLGVCLIRAPAGHRWQTITLAGLFPGKGWDAYCQALIKVARI